MVERISGVKASVGFASETGPRKRNEDFAGAVFGSELPQPRRDVVAAIADGIGGAKGGRVAAETAVRGFLDGFCDLPETMEVRRAAARVLDALNGWIYSQAQRDSKLAGMGCTFTALVLRGRVAHVLHVGDTRAYRLSGDRLTCLTTDHVRDDGTGRSHVLTRALGVETELRLDYATQPMARHDRFLLCSDGVHGFLGAKAIADILRERSASEDTARALVTAALQSGSTDNCTALVLDVVELPTAESAEIGAAIMQLPLIPVPFAGETVDGFLLKVLVSDGRYTRLFGAVDEIEGGEVVLKFPKPQVAAVATYRAAFAREAWVGARVHSPWVGRIIELPPGRQTCLYTVMPLYQGELLETRLDAPAVAGPGGRTQYRDQAGARRRGVAPRRHHPSRHQARQCHSRGRRIAQADRSRRGAGARTGGFPDRATFRARRPTWHPKCLPAKPGNEATDIYALGVTMFRAFTGEFPYGNPDATSPPRRDRPQPLSALRPDLPAWLQATLGRAIAIDPAERFQDVMEFAVEMEAGPARAPAPMPRPQTLYERDPVRFWQGVAALLALALILSLLRHLR